MKEKKIKLVTKNKKLCILNSVKGREKKKKEEEEILNSVYQQSQ